MKKLKIMIVLGALLVVSQGYGMETVQQLRKELNGLKFQSTLTEQQKKHAATLIQSLANQGELVGADAKWYATKYKTNPLLQPTTGGETTEQEIITLGQLAEKVQQGKNAAELLQKLVTTAQPWQKGTPSSEEKGKSLITIGKKLQNKNDADLKAIGGSFVAVGTFVQ